VDSVTEITFESMPSDYNEFIALTKDKMYEPEETAALFILALRVYAVDKELGLKMISFLRNEEELNPMEIKKLLNEPFEETTYLAISYFKGSTPENSYTPIRPYTVVIKNDNLRNINKNLKTLYIGCGGTSQYRPITLKKISRKALKGKKFDDDVWFVNDYSSIVLGIKKPAQTEKSKRLGFDFNF